MSESYNKECDEVCTCQKEGIWECEQRCSGVFFKRGKKLDDPLCTEKPATDECCAVMICQQEIEPEEKEEENSGK